MPTLDEWEQALITPRRVVIESSPGLLGEIGQRHVSKDADRKSKGIAIPPRKNTLTVVDEFSPKLEIDVVPAYMLHRLGVTTTPPVENLADLCSTWAYLRYLWAFEIPPVDATNPPLLLSQDAKHIDFHQKGLMSDQIGVGMAALLLGQCLRAPLAVDVSIAMDDPAWPIVQQYETSPDYIFFNASQTVLFIVECKGTQSSRYSALDQLRRGSEQVPSLAFTDRPNPRSLVIATHLSEDGTRVLVIDPPGDDDLKDRIKSERLSQREWRVRDDAQFDRATRLVSEAKMLTFAGASDIATRKFERSHARSRQRPTVLPRDLSTTENEFGIFKGMRQRVGFQDHFDIEVFQGLDVGVFDALLAEEPLHTEERIRSFQTRTRARVDAIRPQPVISLREDGRLVVGSAGPDGSLFQIQIAES